MCLFFYVERIPQVCGGEGTQPIQKCYRYLPANDTWVVSGTMAHLHVSSGFAYHNEFGLVISGGHLGGNRTSVENVFGNETIQVTSL